MADDAEPRFEERQPSEQDAERASAALKDQIERARWLVTEARRQLTAAHNVLEEARSFAPSSKPTRH